MNAPQFALHHPGAPRIAPHPGGYIPISLAQDIVSPPCARHPNLITSEEYERLLKKKGGFQNHRNARALYLTETQLRMISDFVFVFPRVTSLEELLRNSEVNFLFDFDPTILHRMVSREDMKNPSYGYRVVMNDKDTRPSVRAEATLAARVVNLSLVTLSFSSAVMFLTALARLRGVYWSGGFQTRERTPGGKCLAVGWNTNRKLVVRLAEEGKYPPILGFGHAQSF